MLRWYCVQAHPRSVLYAKRNIDRLGFGTLLPTELRSYLVRGKRKEKLVPLFGNYIFVQFDVALTGWRRITTLPGVRRLFSTTPESPVSIPDKAIDTLKLCMVPQEPVEKAVIQPNCRVRVTKGPLSGTTEETIGLCKWSRGRRVALLLQIMQGEIEVTFDIDSVELVP